ncbi:hypothetical protein [Butyrivibrio sp. WCD3002]|uniref:hypothetical protein n=1 Tax=Butyrivibrio sp. WCD3002 TaxID=1280676 RepID=UPI000402C72A|nr:hypothetical protein [Butyrivibrio sp. WCD3002]
MRKTFDYVDGNMDILMYDNTVRKIKDVKKGDLVYSVQYDGEIHQYIKGEVTDVNRRKGKAVKITLADGRSLISSPNHQWLTQLGWLFTYDDGSLGEDKVYLKNDVKMSGIGGKIAKNYEETKQYMEGYFLGIEIYGKNLVGLKGGEMAEFVLCESAVTMRLYNYLLYLGIEASIEPCFAHNNNTNEHFVTAKLNLPYTQMVMLSEKFAKDRDKDEFLRGFIAGVYDSDGSNNPVVKTLASAKMKYLEILKKGLELYNFEYEYNSQDMSATLFGGASELLRFYHIFTPVLTQQFEHVPMSNVHNDTIKVVSIEEIKRREELIEITTSGRNFIANGVVSHNCTTGMFREVQ